MAELAIISETGMFHSACRCTYGPVVEWYGFSPAQSRTAVGAGSVKTDSRTAFINHLIAFDVPDMTLRAAITAACEKYKDATYALGVRDCVSFSADVARGVGLGVPLVNMTPYGLIQILSVNPYKTLL